MKSSDGEARALCTFIASQSGPPPGWSAANWLQRTLEPAAPAFGHACVTAAMSDGVAFASRDAAGNGRLLLIVEPPGIRDVFPLAAEMVKAVLTSDGRVPRIPLLDGSLFGIYICILGPRGHDIEGQCRSWFHDHIGATASKTPKGQPNTCT